MLMLTPVMRVIERMDMPSTSMERICARFEVGSLFMGGIVSNPLHMSSIFFRSNLAFCRPKQKSDNVPPDVQKGQC